MGMIEAVLFTLVLVAVMAIGFGINHAALNASVKKLDALHATFLATMAEHGISINSIATDVAGHTSILSVLEDKAKNVVSAVEASKFVQDLEASLAKGEAVLKNLVSAANPAPPVSVVVVPAATPAPTDTAFGLPVSTFKPGDPPQAR